MNTAGSICLLHEDTAVKTEFVLLSNQERCVALCGHEVNNVDIIDNAFNGDGINVLAPAPCPLALLLLLLSYRNSAVNYSYLCLR